LRAARLETGQSQTQAAHALGVAFQQIQKYESGTNRISASSLYELSLLLNKPLLSSLTVCQDGVADLLHQLSRQ
jgi:transcriptional regulator with XRE-family HTH domain